MRSLVSGSRSGRLGRPRWLRLGDLSGGVEGVMGVGEGILALLEELVLCLWRFC